jgi:hypothetical protein
MRDLNSLNPLYRHYRAGKITKREFEGEIFKVILDNLKFFHLFAGDEEESIDYLCWLYPRLSRAIQNYRDTGSPFSVYISAMVRYSTREYRGRQVDHYITEYAAWTARAADLEVRSPEAEYLKSCDKETSAGKRKRPRLRTRQILFLLLKSYYFVSEDFIERVAPFSGVKKEKLIRMVEKLRDSRSRKDEEIRLFQERITTQFYRRITWEKRLKSLLPGSARYERVQNQLERTRKRLEKMRGRFAAIKTNATYKQIAEVVGISPGTVASSLFLLKSVLPRPQSCSQKAEGGVEGEPGDDPGQGVCQTDPGKTETGDQEKGGNYAHHRFQDAADSGGDIFAHTLYGAAEDQHEG